MLVVIRENDRKCRRLFRGLFQAAHRDITMYRNLFTILGTAGFCLSAIMTMPVIAESVTSAAKLHGDNRTLVYNSPAADDAPSVRHDGIVRGENGNVSPNLYALAPAHIGTTTYEHPTLYWYQSDATTAKIEIGINKEGKTEPVFETEFINERRPGIHKIELSKYKVKIEKGVEYEWYITIIKDTEDHSKDVIASGVIKRIDPPQSVSLNLQTKHIEDLIYIFAAEGIWYDALECVSKLIEQQPTNDAYRELRAELLDEGDLPEVAEYDRNPEDKE